MRLLLDDSIRMTVDGRIDPECEDMLVVLSQYTRTNNIAVVTGLSRIDINAADDSCGARLNIDTAGLIKLVRKDVFVVGQGDDELHH